LSNTCKGKSELASDTLLFVINKRVTALQFIDKSDAAIYVAETIKENIQRTLVVESNKYIIYIAPKNVWIVLNVNVCESLINNIHYYTQVSDNRELSSIVLMQVVLNNVKKQTRPK